MALKMANDGGKITEKKFRTIFIKHDINFSTKYIHTRTHTYTFTHTHTHTHIYIYIYIWLFVDIFMWIHIMKILVAKINAISVCKMLFLFIIIFID